MVLIVRGNFLDPRYVVIGWSRLAGGLFVIESEWPLSRSQENPLATHTGNHLIPGYDYGGSQQSTATFRTGP